ncbi:hypothetical protein BpHYR1_012388 [Brachionus plicatilis]|uniref:Uncharacterized protein n=1 Tax=Brachionus plicatilis TaxID=10195 RepID=A0A3M7R7M8_BRAPC|nr:hypothetical protein BpHYR1_012388 [Brachionus plicatilis]
MFFALLSILQRDLIKYHSKNCYKVELNSMKYSCNTFIGVKELFKIKDQFVNKPKRVFTIKFKKEIQINSKNKY